jgi:Skp family chaperone for outer membrane proteins
MANPLYHRAAILINGTVFMLNSSTYKLIFFGFMLCSLSMWGQKSQKLAYVDMNYILEEIPDYKKAEDNLNKKIGAWTRSLSELKGEIQQLKSDLSQEKPLLTEVLIEQKEDEILLKELEYKNIELAYFGPRGALFRLRAQLVAPIQDNIYNSIQEIAKKGNYDLVIDKSSELILLYSNKKYDISPQVLRSVLQSEKQRELEEKKTERKDTEFVPDPIKDQRQEELNLQRQARLKAKAERDSIMNLKKEQRIRNLQRQKEKRDSINNKNFN